MTNCPKMLQDLLSLSFFTLSNFNFKNRDLSIYLVISKYFRVFLTILKIARSSYLPSAIQVFSLQGKACLISNWFSCYIASLHSVTKSWRWDTTFFIACHYHCTNKQWKLKFHCRILAFICRTSCTSYNKSCLAKFFIALSKPVDLT